MLQQNEVAITWLRYCFRDKDAQHSIYAALYNNKLNIVILVKNLYQFTGLKEAKDWCDNNIFND